MFLIGQVSKDGRELLCDNCDCITVIDIATGQASAKLDSTTKSITFFADKEDEEESSVEDAYRNANISLDENDVVTSLQMSPDGSKLLVACKCLLLKVYSWPGLFNALQH